MASRNVDTVRAYWDASARSDYEAAGRCVGDGYTWIDHTNGFIAQTAEELQAAMVEDSAWSNRRFEIENIIEGPDGTVVVQATVTGTITGRWRSVEAKGQQVRHEGCTIFRFNQDGLIVSEELYGDALSIMRQLGVADLPG